MQGKESMGGVQDGVIMLNVPVTMKIPLYLKLTDFWLCYTPPLFGSNFPSVTETHSEIRLTDTSIPRYSYT